MEIPESIKIGGRTIEIKRKTSSAMQGELGFYSSWIGRIEIANDPDIDPEQQYVSFIHEIIECLNEKHQYKMEHPVIQGLAENLYQVLKDNKVG